jgi:hypothetical protein
VDVLLYLKQLIIETASVDCWRLIPFPLENRNEFWLRNIQPDGSGRITRYSESIVLDDL